MESSGVPDLPSVTPPLGRNPVTDPEQVSVIVKWANGAYREFAATEPLGYRLAIEAADGRMGRTEPKLLLTFAGNPAKGGVRVDQAGTPPS